MHSRDGRHFGARALPALALAAAAVSIAACGSGHRLGEADFAGGTLAVETYAPEGPALRTPGVDRDEEEGLARVILEAGSDIAREVEARKARTRLRQAAARFDMPERMTERLQSRTRRSLGTYPVADGEPADFVLELDIRRYGVSADDRSASVFLDADAFLLDATGYELWRRSVHAWDRLTPVVDDGVGSSAATAASLSRVTVEELEDALARVADAAASRIDRDLRDDLRDVRRR
jgi:hypothetical protein